MMPKALFIKKKKKRFCKILLLFLVSQSLIDVM